MLPSFTATELDIFRHLIEPKKTKALVYSVLHERHNFPEWTLQAIEHGWDSPYNWLKKERDEISDTATALLDRHWLEIGLDWALVLNERLRNEMAMLALQARGPDTHAAHRS
jgi:hypothetical protein